MIVTIHYEDDSITFDAATIEEAREMASIETKKRGWNEDLCWSEVKK